jgi:acetylornithine deacetylase/succinyl-diaminopimelate desuccinylase-like protein
MRPILALTAISVCFAADPNPPAREIFRELIEINTTDSVGNVTRASEAVARRLKAAGFPETDVQVIGPNDRKRNLVAVLRGTGTQKPILFIAHLDVVEARREDWSFDPFRFLEKDGYFYGRGTSDNKAGAAILVSNFIRLKQEGFRPARDLILALTADEEGGDFNGVAWLLANRRSLIDSEFCVNTDSGEGHIKEGQRILQGLQASEKLFCSFRLEAKSPGGHSSLPVRENAIYQLSEALMRVSAFQFPVKLNEITREFFRREAQIETGSTARDMTTVAANPADARAVERLSRSAYYNALLRTTCVATMLEAGHAENALPQTARAVVNCRLLPDDTPEQVRNQLVGTILDEKVSVAPVRECVASPASPLRPDVLHAVESVTHAMWPDLPVVPVMETGGTDGRLLRDAGIPTYGVAGIFVDVDDVRAHGKDERIGVDSFYNGVDFYYRLIRELAAK